MARAWEIARKASDPEKAQRNLFERDQMFTDRLREATRQLRLCAIAVDVTMTEDDLVRRVTEIFGLGADTGR